MKKNRFWIALAAGLLISTSLQAGGDYMSKGKKDRQYAEPDKDHAVVYFVRPQFVGAAIRFWTFDADEPIGLTRGKTYFYAELTPGEHRFWSKAENVSELTLQLEAGQTYFVKQEVKMGIGKARVNLVELDEPTGRRLIQKLPYSELTDEGRERGAELAEKRSTRADKRAAKTAKN